MRFLKIKRNHPLRQRVESYIHDVYAREYGADLSSFPELLVAMFDGKGELTCAAGIRFSTDGFFSERYLPRPIDRMLDPVWTGPVRRRQIAEVTSLAGTRPGASLILFKQMAAVLREHDVSWVFFTATERLRAILRRSGVPVLDLEAADPGRVDDPEQWGRYYDANPRVVALHDSMQSIDAPGVSDSLIMRRVAAGV